MSAVVLLSVFVYKRALFPNTFIIQRRVRTYLCWNLPTYFTHITYIYFQVVEFRPRKIRPPLSLIRKWNSKVHTWSLKPWPGSSPNYNPLGPDPRPAVLQV